MQLTCCSLCVVTGGLKNSLHFLKDRWWDEDRHWTRRPGLSLMLACLNNAAISIHRLCSAPDYPIRASADAIKFAAHLGLELLNS